MISRILLSRIQLYTLDSKDEKQMELFNSCQTAWSCRQCLHLSQIWISRLSSTTALSSLVQNSPKRKMMKMWRQLLVTTWYTLSFQDLHVIKAKTKPARAGKQYYYKLMAQGFLGQWSGTPKCIEGPIGYPVKNFDTYLKVVRKSEKVNTDLIVAPVSKNYE